MTTAVAAPKSAHFARFVGALEFLYEQGFRGRDFIRAAEPALRRLLIERDWLPEAARTPSEKGYARHLLHRDPGDRFVVAAMVWRPGQGTPIHDHDGTWGMVGMIEGGLEVVNFSTEREARAGGEVSLRREAPHTPKAGEPECVCACADIHQVTNPLGETAVSVHVYPRDLEKCSVFEPVGEGAGRYAARTVKLDYTKRYS
ncbi:MAG: cysteine dioxygenase family protein [Candidatus Tectomicrobia bacterium]|uniref:Cysteine dioxygenase family protein n=1 Tax=Tectimicrobiota bacterium TaxID=2528274 RepID=A0A932HYT1_UNCTE|nr:cysteine dioxygenase family protein [Candidatus Tectomicrobia bacterium]